MGITRLISGESRNKEQGRDVTLWSSSGLVNLALLGATQRRDSKATRRSAWGTVFTLWKDRSGGTTCACVWAK